MIFSVNPQIGNHPQRQLKVTDHIFDKFLGKVRRGQTAAIQKTDIFRRQRTHTDKAIQSLFSIKLRKPFE